MIQEYIKNLTNTALESNINDFNLFKTTGQYGEMFSSTIENIKNSIIENNPESNIDYNIFITAIAKELLLEKEDRLLTILEEKTKVN